MPFSHFRVPSQGGSEEETLNRFLRQHRILKVDKQFVDAGTDSFWAYQVQFADGAAGEAAPAAGKPGAALRKGMVDYKEKLSDDDFRVFLKLKEWRKERAEKEGVEAYNVFTNAQLAVIAERRCASVADLREIPGVGDGRVEKYGEAMLDVVKKLGAEGEPESDD